MIKDIEGVKEKCKKNYQDEFDYLIYSTMVLGIDAISNLILTFAELQNFMWQRDIC